MAARETPPHAWGRRGKNWSEAIQNRNTPTCVGKTPSPLPVAVLLQKHPHMRGEDLVVRRVRVADVETPPHAWGRRNWFDCTATALRNTPTCVGKTGNRVMSILRRWKHPHMRGEDSCTRLRASVALETPPHAWGRPPPWALGVVLVGNTPTCVGKTIVGLGIV